MTFGANWSTVVVVVVVLDVGGDSIQKHKHISPVVFVKRLYRFVSSFLNMYIYIGKRIYSFARRYLNKLSFTPPNRSMFVSSTVIFLIDTRTSISGAPYITQSRSPISFVYRVAPPWLSDVISRLGSRAGAKMELRRGTGLITIFARDKSLEKNDTKGRAGIL